MTSGAGVVGAEVARGFALGALLLESAAFGCDVFSGGGESGFSTWVLGGTLAVAKIGFQASVE